MVVKLVYEVHGDIPDAGSIVTVLAETPINLNKLEQLFPFCGTFHFRVKIEGQKVGCEGCEFVWLDIVDKYDDIYYNAELKVAEIQALVVSLDDDDYCTDYDYELDQYMNEMSVSVPSDRQKKMSL